MEKIMKSTKLVHKILGILFWVVVVACIVFGVVALCTAGLIDNTAVIKAPFLMIGDYTLNVDQAYTGAQLKGLLWFSLVVDILFGVLCCYGIRIVQGILEPMTQGRPFNTAVSDGLNKLSYVVLCFGVAGLILGIAFSFAYDNIINTMPTFPAGVVESHFLRTIPDLQFVVWFLLIRLFRRIFTYGETLQQLSDETL